MPGNGYGKFHQDKEGDHVEGAFADLMNASEEQQSMLSRLHHEWDQVEHVAPNALQCARGCLVLDQTEN